MHGTIPISSSSPISKSDALDIALKGLKVLSVPTPNERRGREAWRNDRYYRPEMLRTDIGIALKLIGYDIGYYDGGNGDPRLIMNKVLNYSEIDNNNVLQVQDTAVLFQYLQGQAKELTLVTHTPVSIDELQGLDAQIWDICRQELDSIAQALNLRKLFDGVNRMEFADGLNEKPEMASAILDFIRAHWASEESDKILLAADSWREHSFFSNDGAKSGSVTKGAYKGYVLSALKEAVYDVDPAKTYDVMAVRTELNRYSKENENIAILQDIALLQLFIDLSTNPIAVDTRQSAYSLDQNNQWQKYVGKAAPDVGSDSPAESSPSSLVNEARDMRDALCKDLARTLDLDGPASGKQNGI